MLLEEFILKKNIDVKVPEMLKGIIKIDEECLEGELIEKEGNFKIINEDLKIGVVRILEICPNDYEFLKDLIYLEDGTYVGGTIYCTDSAVRIIN